MNGKQRLRDSNSSFIIYHSSFCIERAIVFQIKAGFEEQLEVKTTVERAREFFGDLRNFVELMPGVESIKQEAGGVVQWLIRAEIPVIGSVRHAFSVEQTQDRPERIEWSPSARESGNFLRYTAAFEQQGARVLVRIVQRVELRRQSARDLHTLAGLVGERRLSAEMQKGISQMMRTFLQRARTRLEGK
jgi:carbon monoxide dehydrogenase subunit G